MYSNKVSLMFGCLGNSCHAELSHFPMENVSIIYTILYKYVFKHLSSVLNNGSGCEHHDMKMSLIQPCSSVLLVDLHTLIYLFVSIFSYLFYNIN